MIVEPFTEDIPLCLYNIVCIYIYVEYVFYSLKYNNSFIWHLKLHKIGSTSFGVMPSSGPSENYRINLKIKMLCASCYTDIQFLLFFSLMVSHFTIVDQFLTIYLLVSVLCNATCTYGRH